MTLKATIKAPKSAAEVSQLFYRMGMTDGLPIIPPTPEAVEAMLRQSSRGPGEVIGIVPPKQGAATIEKIATNAVMAGCLPDYLPVIVAALEAILEDGFNLYGMQNTTNPATPLFIINGPIGRKLGINDGYNCLGEGTRANISIGRTMRLILRNIGGGIPGDTDRSTQGQPGRLSLCFAENEKESPWAPFHTDRGFKAETSTVTAFGAGGTTNIRPYARDGRGVMAGIARIIAVGSSPRHGYGLIILCPEHAQLMKSEGYSKEDVKRYFYENARVRPSGFTEEVSQAIIDEPLAAYLDVRRVIGEITQDTLIPCFDRPEEVFVVVAGGAGGHCVFVPGLFTQPTSFITKEIR